MAPSSHSGLALSHCDWAACEEPATLNAGGWAFCPAHAEDDRKLREDDADEQPEQQVDLDLVAVERRLAGDHTVSLTPDEVRHAHDQLEARGLSSQDIARALGVEQRTVFRWRSDRVTKPHALRGRPVSTPVPAPAPSPLGLLLEQATGHGNPKVRKLGERVEGLLDDLRTLIEEDVEREQARAEVARLEAELRAAKAKLTGKYVPAARAVARPLREDDARLAPNPCPDCDKVCRGPQGLAAHRRSSHPEAA